MTPRVRATWARRTAAEYRSACVSAEMLHWGLVLGLAPALVDQLHRLVDDERVHADLSREVHAAAGGTPVEAIVHRSELSLGIARDETLERRALAAALQEFALHESVALELFRRMRRVELVPVVHAAVARIVRDEARHRRLGWLLVDAFLVRTGEGDWLRSIVPDAIEGLAGGYRSESPDPTPAESSWGLLGGDITGAIVRRTIEGDIAKRLRQRQLR